MYKLLPQERQGPLLYKLQIILLVIFGTLSLLSLGRDFFLLYCPFTRLVVIGIRSFGSSKIQILYFQKQDVEFYI